MGGRRLIFVTLLLIASIPETLSGQVPSGDRPGDRTVYVVGQVADLTSGQPLGSAHVILRRSARKQ